VLGRAGEAGQKRRLEDAENGVVTWLPPPGLGKPKDMEEAEKKENEERDGGVAKPRILEDESEETGSRRRRGRVDPEDEEDDF
jgi:small subunit ribosomal protein S2